MVIRTLVQQTAAMSALRPPLASSKWDTCNFGISIRCDPPVARLQRWMKRTGLGGKCWISVESLQLSRNFRQSGSQKRTRQLVSPVFSAQPPTSEEIPTAEELKAQLESLQQEASQVRDRYDSSRARFMRLAQVAEQLQQRAVLDLKLGNEGNARQLLMEKKKVMSAAERSKRRSQIYELLSSKLSEEAENPEEAKFFGKFKEAGYIRRLSTAISQKETQLMAALTSIPAAKLTRIQEPTVRVIVPTKDSPVLHEEVFEQELEELFCVGLDSGALSGTPEKKNKNGISPISVKAKGGAERDGDAEEVSPAQTYTDPGLFEAFEHGSIVQDCDSASTAWAENSLSVPSKEEIYSEDELESQLCDELGSAAKNLGTDVLRLQEELNISENDANLEGEMESSPTVEADGARGPKVILSLDEKELEKKTGMNKGHKKSHVQFEEKIETKVDLQVVFEKYLLDIDSQVAGLELKLQSFLVTANIILGSNSEMQDERVVLVKSLLQQVKSLRTRMLEGVNKSQE